MRPLIDGDILLHELGWSGGFKDKETKEVLLMEFDFVADLLDKKLTDICKEVNASESPLIFITNSEWIQEVSHRLIHEVPDYYPLFRHKFAVTKPYKGNRKNPKPFHFANIIVYLDTHYDLVISSDGYEADDELCIMQCSDINDTVICSRDKDLRICPGWHYSWECGNQPSVGPVFTDELGWLELNAKGKVFGYGKKFFYYQLLMGDGADNIPGLPGFGEKTAYKLLKDVGSVEECHKLVKEAYKSKMEDQAKEYFLEQANLLWMLQERGKFYGSKILATETSN